MGKTIGQYISLGYSMAFNAAFSRVLVPKECFLNNMRLSIMQKIGYGIVAGGILMLVLNAPAAYLILRIPQGFPRMKMAQSSTHAATVTSEMTSADNHDFCGATNNKYAYISAEDGVDSDGLGRWGDFTCINGPLLFDEREVENHDGLFVPTAFIESERSVAMETTACGNLETACAASPAGDWTGKTAGATHWTAATPGTACVCREMPRSYFLAGATAHDLTLHHMIKNENPTGGTTQSFSYKSDLDNPSYEPFLGLIGNERKHHLLTKIMTYDAEAEKWADFDCGTGTAGNQCQFGDGEHVTMTVDQWLAAAGISSLDNRNDESGMPANTDLTYGSQTGDANPTFRVSGVEVALQLEYFDSAFHSDMTYDDGTGTLKKFPGLVCFVKVTANKTRTSQRRTDWKDIAEASEVAGSLRRRWSAGIKFSGPESPNSKVGFFTLIGLVGFLAVTVIYFQFVTLGCMIFSIYCLGNTSRNYARVVREHVNVAVQASRRTPAKLMQAAVCYFLMREWEHDQEAMKHFMDDHSTVHKETIWKFMNTCFAPDLLPEIEPDEVQDMADACFDELTGGGEREGVTLIEFLDAALSSEAVDYIATKAAFNKQRWKNPLEKFFGDNVQSYAKKDARMCFGLVQNPSSIKDARENAGRNKLRASLATSLAGVGSVAGAAGSAAKLGGGLMKMGASLAGKGAGMGIGGIGKLAGAGADVIGLGGNDDKKDDKKKA